MTISSANCHRAQIVWMGERTQALTTGSIAKNVSRNVQVLPDDEGLNGAELEGLQSILDTEAVFACILTDLVEVSLD